ncbi:MAG: hypothetical protein AAGL98_12825, partial [Planctomycetota bacterium]
MVVSLAVIAVLLVGMSSAIVLASRALPHATNPAGATVNTARALHGLRDELRAATELPSFDATSVTLHLPDRDGDGLSNSDEEDCGSDPDNPDTDGDGIGDLEEGPCDEDVGNAV